MRRSLRPSLGLIGQIFAILLLAILIEFGASTFFYERASQLSVREDEARRLAEHLIIARKLLDDSPADTRVTLAQDLTTSRYSIGWTPKLPSYLAAAQTLDRIHEQVLVWEPSLASSNLRLRLSGTPRRVVIAGGLTLEDGTWMEFGTREPIQQLGFSIERMLLALGPAVAIILAGGVLVRQTLLPMRRLAHAAEHVGSDIAEEVPEGGAREVRRVIRAFNRMQARIHRLIDDRTQALAAVGHDLRTPLARLRLRADAIGDPAVLDAIQGDIGEMEAMIGSLLAYLSGDVDVEPRVSTDLAVMCATIADDAADHGHAVTYDGPEHLEMMIRPTTLKRAMVNLVENGVHYADTVWLKLEAGNNHVAICVEDDGPGIPEDALRTVLEPFVRLDRARARDTLGLGLGLSIVAKAVDSEGGTLKLGNRREGGLRAQIILQYTHSA
ncbi:ATP-binding protein [Sphingomonas xinjiangensis]|uniref:histidine kinase n=1 Tax=Sphingomonas xinjiangensis TaxID=643568 RepID=A0A840Y7V2_9SPHN|nr:ATP-binding protein [Sphingomonas xinjiangensis]MBB5709377.1 signal transduction histidine kinase [Sphingomonas xinjiangensis]